MSVTLRSDGGFSQKQADEQADAQANALHGALQGLATKADMELLRVQVESLVREMQALRQFMVIGMMAGFGWMTLMIGLVTAVFKFL